MSLSSRSGPDGRFVLLAWVLASAFLIWQTAQAPNTPLFTDTDDAMRLVVARDLLGGQNWFDLVQHRLNTPFGAVIHWSRLIDAPLAALLWLCGLVLPPADALVATATIWPLLLLGVLLWLSAALAMRLVGPDGLLPALVLPVLHPAVTAEFEPGRVDHHSVVIILTLALLWASIEAVNRPRWAWGAGLIAATSLAIATESLPAAIAAIAVFGFLWVAAPTQARAMRGFGLGFAGGSLFHLAIAQPPTQWLVPACDMLSVVFVGGAVVVGAVFVALSFTPLRHPAMRLLALAVLGLGGLAILLLLYPQCLKGPYGALDPWLQQHWIANILEARPWWISVGDLPGYSMAVAVPVLLALLFLIVRLWRVPAERPQWAVLGVFLLVATAVMLAQIRGARLAIMPALPVVAWAILALRTRFLAGSRLAVFGLVGVWLACAGLVVGTLTTLVVNSRPGRAQEVSAVRSDKAPCLMPAAFADLAALPPERLMTPIDLGAHMLLYTPHAVVSAPYHRNEQGVLDTFDFFNLDLDRARPILQERGIDFVVTCPAMPEMAGLGGRDPNSFITRVAENRLPPWLVDQSRPGSPLRIYAVLPEEDAP